MALKSSLFLILLFYTVVFCFQVYKERLTMPKLFILATGDEFFYPQDMDTWWDEIPEPKYIM
jgi:PhoPQ-activated pathogenicity-related protein